MESRSARSIPELLVLLTVLLGAGRGLADPCLDCTKLAKPGPDPRAAPPPIVVMRAAVAERLGPETETPPALFHPELPGMKRVLIGGKKSKAIYQDADMNLYERFPLKLSGGAHRDMLQRLRNGGAEGIHGDFAGIAPSARADLASLLDGRFDLLSTDQKGPTVRFLLGQLAPGHRRRPFYCAWAREHADLADAVVKCR